MQAAQSLAKADLSFPGDFQGEAGRLLEAFLEVHADLGGEALGPGALDENASGVGVSGLGDRSLASSRSARGFGGDQSEISHEESRVRESCEVSDLGDDGDGHGEGHAPQSLDGGVTTGARRQ